MAETGRNYDKVKLSLGTSHGLIEQLKAAITTVMDSVGSVLAASEETNASTEELSGTVRFIIAETA